MSVCGDLRVLAQGGHRPTSAFCAKQIALFTRLFNLLRHGDTFTGNPVVSWAPASSPPLENSRVIRLGVYGKPRGVADPIAIRDAQRQQIERKQQERALAQLDHAATVGVPLANPSSNADAKRFDLLVDVYQVEHPGTSQADAIR